MIAPLYRSIAAQAVIVLLVSCMAPEAARSVPHGYAAFAPKSQPWQKDLVRSVPPVYSDQDRAAWRQGTGIFHLVLDSTTGAVVQVSIRKSTGYPTLDSAAVSALKQWRFRPGSWKTLDIPVQFRRASSHQQYRERIREDQEWGRQL